MKQVANKISLWVVALLFIFSGATKGINPFGLSNQFGDYFTAMGIEFLQPLAPLFALLLPTIEMLLGVLLLLNVYKKIVSWVVLSFMVFFSGLTLWIAVYNPVSDCGCFGDLLVISNKATFIKNLIFLIPTIILFINRKEKSKNSWKTATVAFMVCGLLPLYSYNRLPIIDATPYKLGVNILDAMEDGVPDESKTTLLYKNIESGEVKEFEIEDTEWQNDEKWKFVDTNTKIIKKGKPNSITQLPMIDRNGEDVAEEILSTEGKILIIVSPSPAFQSAQIVEKVAEARTNNISSVILLHSQLGDIAIDGVKVYTTDNTTLKTIIQYHGGGVLTLEDGKIVAKTIL